MKVEVGVKGFLPVKSKNKQTKPCHRGLCGRKATELRSCLKEEVDVIGIVRTVLVDVKQQ